MMVETTRFGSIDLTDNEILNFPEGMLGFAKIHEYVLVERNDHSLFLWLQSIKKPSVAFPLLEPQIFEPNYRIEILDDDEKLLGIKKISQAKIFSIITIPSDPTKMTANLKAPIVINVSNRKAKQVIMHNIDYPIRKAIFSELQKHCSGASQNIIPQEDSSNPVVYHAVRLGQQTELPA